MALAAVDRDLVAARRQAGGKFFGEGLEAAVIGRNAARAEKRDAHRTQHYVLAASERDSTRAIFFGACLLTGAYWNQLAMYSSSTRRRAWIRRRLASTRFQVLAPGTRRP